MPSNIHPTAIIAPEAELGEGVEIGAYAYIGPKVRLGDGCVVHHHATVEGNTLLGRENEIFPYAFVGGRTQDKKWTGDDAPIIIGDNNKFREFVTVHPATFATEKTTIGSHNLFCSYAHIGHESRVGNHVVFSNNATLGGHVDVGDHVVIGGLTAVHQFCKIGRGAMVGGCCKLVQDVVPYMIADGWPATHRGINKVGMTRIGFSEEELSLAKRIFKHLFKKGHNHREALEQLENGVLGDHPMVQEVIGFCKTCQRGLA